MTEWLTLLKILIFGGSTIITPTSIDISAHGVEVVLADSIEAINGTASMNIDVTPYLSVSSASEFFKEIETVFPKGCVKALLISDDISVELSDSSGRWAGEDGKYLNLRSIGGVPTNVEFNAVRIESCKAIENTNVTWHNYGK